MHLIQFIMYQQIRNFPTRTIFCVTPEITRLKLIYIAGLGTEIKMNIDINFSINVIHVLNIDINFGITEIQVLNIDINFGITKIQVLNIDINIDIPKFRF